jgi:SAM-dependent methyltransferase
MSHSPSYNNPEFDQFAENYEEALDKGIAVSGESKEYFAKSRVDWLAKIFAALGFTPKRAMDFGCGTGTATPFLLELPGLEELVGVEVSPKSLDVARRLHGGPRVQFRLCHEFEPSAGLDFAFCNGVFHHIPLPERANAVRYLLTSLRPGGFFALWENNPWNPGARYVMSRIPFDRDAIMVSPREAAAMLKESGFEIVRTDFLFFFPRVLRWLRGMDPMLRSLPLGAQYLVLARRPLPRGM